jgi:hypothetical protein
MTVDPEAERMPRPRKIDTALLGIVLTLLLQGVTAIWWAATMNNRMTQLEKDLAPARTVFETVARLDERSKAMESSTARIERKLDSLEQRR